MCFVLSVLEPGHREMASQVSKPVKFELLLSHADEMSD